MLMNDKIRQLQQEIELSIHSVNRIIIQPQKKLDMDQFKMVVDLIHIGHMLDIMKLKNLDGQENVHLVDLKNIHLNKNQ